MKHRRQLALPMVAAFVAAIAAGPCLAQPAGKKAPGSRQDYPVKPVRLVNPFPPGGGSDAVAHLVSQRLFERWGQSFIVDNRGGAGGAIGTDLAARSNPDGYTLAMATASTLVINPLLNKVPFDPVKDFEPVVHTATIPLILVVHPSVQVKTAKELIALAKAQPGKLNYASSGEGTISHLASELFKSLTGVNIVHVPFRGGGPARNATLGGHVQLNFANLLSAAPFVKDNRLRALGVSTRKRASGMPEVPTLAEAGVPGYEVLQWNGVIAPRGTPKAIIATLNREINDIVARPDVQKLLVDSGAEPEGGTPEEFGAFIKADIAKWAKVIRDTRLKVSP
jgi:tripartite-type tricarboxylate transporter receptor subunit TctC